MSDKPYRIKVFKSGDVRVVVRSNGVSVIWYCCGNSFNISTVAPMENFIRLVNPDLHECE